MRAFACVCGWGLGFGCGGVGLLTRFALTDPIIPPPTHTPQYPDHRCAVVTCGPEGCNLFVFHIPNDMSNMDLYNVFSAYGTVVSVRCVSTTHA